MRESIGCPLALAFRADASCPLTITPQNNSFSSAITLSATGLPAKTSFNFNPSSVAPGANLATSTLVVSTTAGDQFVASNFDKNRTPFFALLVPLTGLFLSAFRQRQAGHKRPAWTFTAVLLLFSDIGLYGCAGASKNFQTLGTPPGTYTVTVTATSGSVQHSAPVTLIVQP